MKLRVYNDPLLRPVSCAAHHSKRMILSMVLEYLKLQKTRVTDHRGSPLTFEMMCFRKRKRRAEEVA